MKKKLQLTAALVLLLVVVAWRQWHGNRLNPVIEGHRLSEWLLPTHDLVSKANKERAIRSIGTNAIPLLLELISADSDTAYFRINDTAARFMPKSFTHSEWQREMGLAGFVALGSLGQPAVPELLRLMENENLRTDVVRALGATRDPQVFTMLGKLIVDGDRDERQTGLQGLEAMAEDGRSMADQLRQIASEDQDDLTRAYAISALGTIGGAEATVPFLMDRLQTETNQIVLHYAAMMLGNFPTHAHVIRPCLTNVMQTGSVQVAHSARIGLQSLNEAEFVAKLKGPANAAILRSLTNGVAK